MNNNMNNFTNEAAWDTRDIYFETLGEALRLAYEARVYKDVERWFGILDGIYSQYHPPFSVEEKTHMIGLLNEINDALHPGESPESFDPMPGNQRVNQAYELLRSFEPLLIDLLYDHNMLSPRRHDVRNSVTEGQG